MAAVITVPVVGTLLPLASTSRMTGCGDSSTPLCPATGIVVIASAAAAPGSTVKALLVAPVRPPELAASVYPAPLLFDERVPKVATPATALTVVVPPSVLPPGLVPMAIVIEAVEVVTRLPSASRTSTCKAGAIATPATSVPGWTMKASALAAAGVMSKPVLVAGVRAPPLATRV